MLFQLLRPGENQVVADPSWVPITMPTIEVPDDFYATITARNGGFSYVPRGRGHCSENVFFPGVYESCCNHDPRSATILLQPLPTDPVAVTEMMLEHSPIAGIVAGIQEKTGVSIDVRVVPPAYDGDSASGY